MEKFGSVAYPLQIIKYYSKVTHDVQDSKP